MFHALILFLLFFAAAMFSKLREARADAQRARWDENASVNDTPLGAARLAALRRKVQDTHPDRGGNVEEFHKAKKALDRANGR